MEGIYRKGIRKGITCGSYTDNSARSSIRSFITKAAAVSRVSPVSFLKANPKIASFFPVTVLNILLTILWANRRFW